MKIDRVKIERTFNLCGYESLRVAFEAELTEADNALDAAKALEDLCEMHLQTRLARTEKPKATAQPQPAAPKETDRNTTDAKLILNEFPPELANLLDIAKVGKVWILKPISYLGTEKWKKIHDIVKACGGRWVGAGKESNWEIPK